jgi:hypothetical protein
MAEEITVSSNREKPAKRPSFPLERLSPIATGLLYGGAASAIAGPFGLLAGLAAGVLHKRTKDSYLDQVAADMQNTRSEYGGLRNEIESELEVADPDERRLLESAKRTAADGWYRLQSGDERGRAMIEQANETIRGIMNSDIQARKVEQAAQFNTQRGLVTNAATAFRDQYSTTINQVREIDSRAERVFQLVADPNFDPDKPFSKSVLTELVSSSLGGLFKDDPNGLLNGLAGMGSTGSEVGAIVGAIAQLGKKVVDTDDFKITREEYNRIALNIREVTKMYAQQRLGEISQQSEGLDAFAKKVGAIPTDYSLRDYVSGGIRELQVAPAISVPSISTETKQPSPAQETTQWQNQQSQGPQRRARQRLTAPELAPLSDDWFRQQVGIPTQRQRRPTN